MLQIFTQLKTKGDFRCISTFRFINRLNSVTVNSTTYEYGYNPFGQRVLEDVKVNTYGQSGELLSVHDGVTYKEYVYLNGMKVAVVENGVINYIHNNYLGVPAVITDASANIVWEGDYKPFGEVYNVNGTLSNNIRFPGQYKNEESGYSYNYFRDYDPTIGRYLQSDPIGLNGGINTYGYVGGNPINGIDPFGLYTLGDAKDSLKQRGVTPESKGLLWDSYSDTQVFNEWLRLEKSNKGWLNELTPCPKRVEMCEAPTWSEPSPANSEHPGGVLEVRSSPTLNGHANQCVYDANGDIMTNIPAAGTADYGAHSYNIFSKHTSHDWWTWRKAKLLGREADYYDVRPIIVEE